MRSWEMSASAMFELWEHSSPWAFYVDLGTEPRYLCLWRTDVIGGAISSDLLLSSKIYYSVYFGWQAFFRYIFANIFSKSMLISLFWYICTCVNIYIWTFTICFLLWGCACATYKTCFILETGDKTMSWSWRNVCLMLIFDFENEGLEGWLSN